MEINGINKYCHVSAYIAYDKDKKKNSENPILYMDLITEYVERKQKKTNR